MINMNNSGDYFSNKISLLEQCLGLSEELISNINNLESLDGILLKRQSVIEKIQYLDTASEKGEMESCSTSQKEQIQQVLSIILSLDQDARRLLLKEQEKTTRLMKNNIQGQRVIGYAKDGKDGNGSCLKGVSISI